jgi:GTPase SAR1 family protein
MKVMVVGYGGRGKSTLLRALMKELLKNELLFSSRYKTKFPGIYIGFTR